MDNEITPLRLKVLSEAQEIKLHRHSTAVDFSFLSINGAESNTTIKLFDGREYKPGREWIVGSMEQDPSDPFTIRENVESKNE